MTLTLLDIILIVLGALALCAIVDDLWYCVKLRYKTRSKSRRAENRGMNNHAH